MSAYEKEDKELKNEDDDKADNPDDVLNEEKSLKTKKDKKSKVKEMDNNINVKNDKGKKSGEEAPNETGTVGETEYLMIPDTMIRSLTVILFSLILGIILILLGIVKLTTEWGIINGNILLFLGFVVTVPGGYYGYQFYKAKSASSDYERKEILDSIPRV